MIFVGYLQHIPANMFGIGILHMYIYIQLQEEEHSQPPSTKQPVISTQGISYVAM